MKIYISGKITGLPPRRVKKKFKDAADYLRAEGYIPVNPAVMDGNPGLDYEDYMYVSFAMIDICDAIYMLHDWKDSPGAIREREYAIKAGKEVVYEHE